MLSEVQQLNRPPFFLVLGLLTDAAASVCAVVVVAAGADVVEGAEAAAGLVVLVLSLMTAGTGYPADQQKVHGITPRRQRTYPSQPRTPAGE